MTKRICMALTIIGMTCAFAAQAQDAPAPSSADAPAEDGAVSPAPVPGEAPAATADKAARITTDTDDERTTDAAESAQPAATAQPLPADDGFAAPAAPITPETEQPAATEDAAALGQGPSAQAADQQAADAKAADTVPADVPPDASASDENKPVAATTEAAEPAATQSPSAEPTWQSMVIPYISIGAGALFAAMGLGLVGAGTYPAILQFQTQSELTALEGEGGGAANLAEAQRLQNESYDHEKNFQQFGAPVMAAGLALLVGGIAIAGGGAYLVTMSFIEE